jgi:hypothetical protein
VEWPYYCGYSWIDFLGYEGLSVDEAGENMVEGYIGITYRELLILFRVNCKSSVTLKIASR